jgi:hypothetical protein
MELRQQTHKKNIPLITYTLMQNYSKPSQQNLIIDTNPNSTQSYQ